MSGGIPDGGGILDPGGAMERLEAWKGRIDKLAADTQAMSGRFQQLRETASDDEGLVEVTVDSSGNLVDLRLTRKIQRAAPETVSAAILETVAKAKAKIAERSQQIITETLGTGTAAREIAERVGQGLRPPEPGAGPGGRDVPGGR